MTNHPVLTVPLAALIAALTLAACGSDGRTADTKGGGGKKVAIEASFYPLQWMAEQIGGPHVSVENLTKPGAEPHDLELTPSDVAAVADADLIVYLSGFQPAVDEAVGNSDATVFDATDSADLDLTFTPIEEGEEHDDEAGAVDPHFWLDPSRLTAVAQAFTKTLGDQDPGNREAYQRNLATLTSKLDALDQEFDEGLADCANADLVTSHNAFGYLARRYGLKQIGITGLTPEVEPSAGQIAAVTDFVNEHDVQTIYFETLVSPAIAKTVASETGAETAVLDPIEGLNSGSEGSDYLEVMRSNLANIEAGQPCS